MRDGPPKDGDDLLKKVREEIASRSGALVRGAPADYANYQNLVGVITGLTLAEQLILGLLENMDDRDT